MKGMVTQMRGLLSSMVMSNATDIFRQYVVQPIMGIRFPDVLDILSVAAILFALFLYLKRRRAGRIVLGGAFVTLFFLLGTAIGMPIISATWKTLSSIWLIILLVIFQAEIRDLLLIIGRMPMTARTLLRARRQPEKVSRRLEKTVTEIGKAVEVMSKEKIGALIVIERAVKLGDYYKKLERLDAEVNSALIRSIFHSGGPLHDGALIISRGKIRAASCQLPQTYAEHLNPALGERHKAAIGISECSDAVVIVVSEETGTVSIAQDCQLKRGYGKDELEAELFLLLSDYSTSVKPWDAEAAAEDGAEQDGKSFSAWRKK